jgi:hypothetical protein
MNCRGLITADSAVAVPIELTRALAAMNRLVSSFFMDV